MPTSSNQNANTIQEMLRDLQKEVSAIPVMLSAFDTRITKLEQRMDKLDDVQRTGTQWANDQHAEMMSVFTSQVQQSEQRIIGQLEKSATELKNAEIRLNVRMDEQGRFRGNAFINIVLTAGGWLVAMFQFFFPHH